MRASTTAGCPREASLTEPKQGRLLLNLGCVREGERLVYDGIPWLVETLSIYSRLVNPDLTGGVLTLPLRSLLTLQSRPHFGHEPWFPCREGDWVILADGTYGRVAVQTIEMVQLELPGGSRKTYPTQQFLTERPDNLSQGFRLAITFGIDYEHQSICTEEVPPKLETAVREGLEEGGYGCGLRKVLVSFKEAGASSLDLAILADFGGSLAHEHETLSRMIPRLAVEACNEHGWVIPFTQLTIHNAAGR